MLDLEDDAFDEARTDEGLAEPYSTTNAEVA